MLRTERALAVLMAAAIAASAGCAGTGAGSNTRSSADNANPNRDAAALQVKMGQEYLNRGDLETARERLRRALELDPASADAHTVMAILHERIRRPQLAETHYRRAVELRPEAGATNNNYGTFLCSNGRYEEARRYFDRALADPFYRTPEVAYANAGFCAIKAGDEVTGERMLRASLEQDPRQPGALIELARISFDRGEPMRARAFLQRFEAIAAPDAFAYELGARIEARLGDRRAEVRYRELLKEHFPDHVPTSDSNGAGSQ